MDKDTKSRIERIDKNINYITKVVKNMWYLFIGAFIIILVNFITTILTNAAS